MNQKAMAYLDIFVNSLPMLPLPLSTSRRVDDIASELEESLGDNLDTVGSTARMVGRNLAHAATEVVGAFTGGKIVIAGMAEVERAVHYVTPDFDGASLYALGALVTADVIYEVMRSLIGSEDTYKGPHNGKIAQ